MTRYDDDRDGRKVIDRALGFTSWGAEYTGSGICSEVSLRDVQKGLTKICRRTRISR